MKPSDLYLKRPWKILKYSDAKLQNEKVKISIIRRSPTQNGREARVHSGLTKFEDGSVKSNSFRTFKEPKTTFRFTSVQGNQPFHNFLFAVSMIPHNAFSLLSLAGF
jgi:hypothetical protein